MSDDGKKTKPAGALVPGALVPIGEPLGLSMRGARIGALDPAVLTLLQSLVANAVSNQKVPIERRIFLTLAESAELSGLSPRFLKRLIRDGSLKAIRAGARWRIPRAELEALADKLTKAPAAPKRTEQLSEAEERDLELNRLRRQGLLPPEVETQEIN